MIYEQYYIYFTDPRRDVITITEDDDLMQSIADLCDREGWDTETVLGVERIEVWKDEEDEESDR